MNELKPEDVMRVLARFEYFCENVGSVKVSAGELNAIADLLCEKDAEIEKLRKDIAACQKSTEYWYGRYAEAQLRINEYADMLMDEKGGGE